MENQSPQSKPSMGSLPNGVAAPYNFSIIEVLKQAWAGIDGFKATFWGAFGYLLLAFIATFVVIFAIDFVAINFLHVNETPMSVVGDIVFLLVVLPLMVGALMLGVRRSVMLPVQARMIGHYFNRTGSIVLVYLAQLVILWVVFFLAGLFGALAGSTTSIILKTLFIVLGIISTLASIYLVLGYIFAYILKVEKNLSVWQSLEVSRKAVSQHWFKIFFSFLMLDIILMISIIPLGIGLIWSLPLLNLYYGMLYRTIFGVEEVR